MMYVNLYYVKMIFLITYKLHSHIIGYHGSGSHQQCNENVYLKQPQFGKYNTISFIILQGIMVKIESYT